MLTLPEYAKKNGYKYNSVNAIIKYLEIKPDVEIQHFRAFEESKLDSLFEQLEPLKNYNPEKANYSRPDKTQPTNNDTITATSF